MIKMTKEEYIEEEILKMSKELILLINPSEDDLKQLYILTLIKLQKEKNEGSEDSDNRMLMLFSSNK